MQAPNLRSALYYLALQPLPTAASSPAVRSPSEVPPLPATRRTSSRDQQRVGGQKVRDRSPTALDVGDRTSDYAEGSLRPSLTKVEATPVPARHNPEALDGALVGRTSAVWRALASSLTPSRNSPPVASGSRRRCSEVEVPNQRSVVLEVEGHLTSPALLKLEPHATIDAIGHKPLS